jgi:uncharacterized repeat protein (TIGR01451 family)
MIRSMWSLQRRTHLGRRTSFRLVCELMESRQLLSTYLVTNTSDAPTPSANSLRWAILQANADNSVATIDFAIPGTGVKSIQLTSPLPEVVNSVVLDGSSQPTYHGVPLIQVDGSGLGPETDGLVISGGGSTIGDLAIVGFSGSAIVLDSAGGDVVVGNYLGVAPSSGLAEPNGEGISVNGSSHNTIGGTASGAGNLISGNTTNGIDINIGGGPAIDNQVIGNLIGTTGSGLAALANGGAGILIAGASSTQIGNASSDFSNVISGNLGAGIDVTSAASGTTILNNAIGVGGDGTTLVGNGEDGILVDSGSGATVGGSDQNQGNVIGGNGQNGIETSAGAGGIIVAGNFIGTDSTGKLLNLGNGENGIQLASSSNTIGGTGASVANTIDFNGSGQAGSGVQLVGSVNQNAILSNSIYGNAGYGINLGDGPTPNHAPGTPGPNNYQNYPTLSSSQSDGSTITTITGSLNSIANSTFLIQFFASPSAGQGGFGQGENLIASESVQTDRNGNVTFTVPISAGTDAGQFISATATGPGGNTSEFSADVQVQPEINLILSAKATPSPVAAGSELTYTISVTNSGDLAADNVILTDLLPGSVTKVSASVSVGHIEPSMGTTVNAGVGTLAAGATATLTIVVATTASSIGTITDSASVSSLETDPTPSKLSISIDTSVLAASDLSVVMTASSSSVVAGGDVTDTFTISNLGPEDASGVTASLPLAPGVSFVSAIPGSATVTSSGGQVSATVATMAANTQIVVTVIVEPTIAGVLDQMVTVSSDGLDGNLSNNTSSTTTQVVPAADIAVTISGSSPEADPKDDFVYTVSATNDGPSDATGVVLLDTLPAGVTFVSASSSQASAPTYSNGVVSLSIADISQGTTVTLAIVVAPTAEPGSTLLDSASVAAVETDPDTTNNTATLATPVVGVSDLGISVTAQPGTAYVGQDVAFTVTVSNQGPNDEPDAIMTLPVSANVAFASAMYLPGWSSTLADGLLTADLGPMPAGGTAAVTVVLIPQAAAAGTLTTTFSIQGDNTDPATTNDTAEVTLTVLPAADLGVTISPGGGRAAIQADWTYTLNVANLGLSNATGVTLTAPLPPGAQFVTARSSQGSTPVVQDGKLTADLDGLAAGGAATISIVVIPTAIGSMPLSASVSGDQFDPTPANNQATGSASVAPSVNLSVVLAANPSTVVAGLPLAMTATIENLGPNPATSVVLNLPMGANLLFNSTGASAATSGVLGGQFVAQVGDLDPGSSKKINLVFTAQTPGTFTQSANVTSAENQLDPAKAVTTMTVTILASPGTLQWSAPLYSVPETAGFAVLPVVRTVGSLGAVTINYQTVAVNATPGVDFIPTSGVLTFAAGQSVGTIQVPVLADPWDNHDEYVNVSLSSPGEGATLGTLSTAQLRIIDVDPDTTPPEVSRLAWNGTSKSITSVTVSFTEPLNSTYATNLASYQLTALVGGLPSVPISTVSYNSSTHTVTLVPAAPLASGVFYQIQVMGTGMAAIRDVANNLLEGASNGLPGSNYVASFGQGTKLKYVDNSGNKVSLKLSGPGYLEEVLFQGQGQTLTLMGEAPHRTALSGTLKKTKRSSGKTNLGAILGLGNFGDVKVSLKSPPFLVKQYPFQQKGHGKL